MLTLILHIRTSLLPKEMQLKSKHSHNINISMTKDAIKAE